MNKEKRIRELEARVAYLETITQSSAHTLLEIAIILDGFCLILKCIVRKQSHWH